HGADRVGLEHVQHLAWPSPAREVRDRDAHLRRVRPARAGEHRAREPGAAAAALPVVALLDAHSAVADLLAALARVRQPRGIAFAHVDLAAGEVYDPSAHTACDRTPDGRVRVGIREDGAHSRTVRLITAASKRAGAGDRHRRGRVYLGF